MSKQRFEIRLECSTTIELDEVMAMAICSVRKPRKGAATIRRIYRLPNSSTVVDVRAPFYLDDKRMFDDGDLLIATFEKAEEGPPIINLINSAETLLAAAKEAISLLDDHVDNALDATIALREAIRKVEKGV